MLGGDNLNHNQLDTLLNDGTDTTATQPGGHTGSDDARSVIVDGYTLVLPTTDELIFFTIDPSITELPSVLRSAAHVWAADLSADGNTNRHQDVRLDGSNIDTT